MRALVASVAVLVLAGCSGSSSGSAAVQPGPSSSAPACTRLLNKVPATLLGLKHADSAARGATAWGEHAGHTIVLRCGVTPPTATTSPCITTDDVDWIFDETGTAYVFTTFGREPAVEVSVPKSISREQAPGAMAALAGAVKPLPQGRHCTDLDDVPSSS
ncbi:DUF3515 family protein [Spongisporangium articulatum]|uniref:DUF3515 family protein n=1 Tax=Spongisporangium articulatum TaxID=3362603 RepID=A0ABW8AN31_9ACTN